MASQWENGIMLSGLCNPTIYVLLLTRLIETLCRDSRVLFSKSTKINNECIETGIMPKDIVLETNICILMGDTFRCYC